jgi:hypothetical protein
MHSKLVSRNSVDSSSSFTLSLQDKVLVDKGILIDRETGEVIDREVVYQRPRGDDYYEKLDHSPMTKTDRIENIVRTVGVRLGVPGNIIQNAIDIFREAKKLKRTTPDLPSLPLNDKCISAVFYVIASKTADYGTISILVQNGYSFSKKSNNHDLKRYKNHALIYYNMIHKKEQKSLNISEIIKNMMSIKGIETILPMLAKAQKIAKKIENEEWANNTDMHKKIYIALACIKIIIEQEKTNKYNKYFEILCKMLNTQSSSHNIKHYQNLIQTLPDYRVS